MAITTYEVGIGTLALLATGVLIQSTSGTQPTDPTEQEKQSKCLSNIKSIATGFQLYISDYDDVWPLAVPRGETGSYAPTRLFGVSSSAAGDGWASSLMPYLANRALLKCPSAIPIGQAPDDRRLSDSSYTYNGLLHGYGSAGMVAPAELVSIWEGWGNAYVAEEYGSNPQLMCHDGSPPCVFAGAQGPSGIMFAPLGTMWIHNQGYNNGYADSHAKWRRAGIDVETRQTHPSWPDWALDPFTKYDDEGMPERYWHDELHPLLFKPDFDYRNLNSRPHLTQQEMASVTR